MGEIEDETFSARRAEGDVPGVGIHPGYAKGQLVNPVKLAARFSPSLPRDTLSPETTEGREGFVHPYEIAGGAGAATVRDPARPRWRKLERTRRSCAGSPRRSAAATPARASASTVRTSTATCARRSTGAPSVVAAAEEATRRAGLEPRLEAIRGGTDGSRLTEMGLPTPNIFTGGNDFHSVREWVSVQDMGAGGATIVDLAQIWAEQAS